MMKNNYISINAYILAGGKSSRMGTDKGLLEHKGRTFVKHISNALSTVVNDRIKIISSNTAYDQFNYSRINDLIADKGPAGGIYTALKDSNQDWIFIISVDTPLLTNNLLAWMVENLDTTKDVCQLQKDENTSPLIALYHKNCLPTFENNIKNNQLKLRKIVSELKNQTLSVPQQWAFQMQNINTINEYKSLIE
jgi:molybdenum cofactor guanylyltransferase